jgi:hypothetical protein
LIVLQVSFNGQLPVCLFVLSSSSLFCRGIIVSVSYLNCGLRDGKILPTLLLPLQGCGDEREGQMTSLAQQNSSGRMSKFYRVSAVVQVRTTRRHERRRQPLSGNYPGPSGARIPGKREGGRERAIKQTQA